MSFLLLFSSAYFKQHSHRKKNSTKGDRKSSAGTAESSKRENPQPRLTLLHCPYSKQHLKVSRWSEGVRCTGLRVWAEYKPLAQSSC